MSPPGEEITDRATLDWLRFAFPREIFALGRDGVLRFRRIGPDGGLCEWRQFSADVVKAWEASQ